MKGKDKKRDSFGFHLLIALITRLNVELYILLFIIYLPLYFRLFFADLCSCKIMA